MTNGTAQVQPEFQGGPGFTAPNVLIDGDHLRDYLDMAIRQWRIRRDAAEVGQVRAEQAMATHYVDAFQSVRASVFGEVLP